MLKKNLKRISNDIKIDENKKEIYNLNFKIIYDLDPLKNVFAPVFVLRFLLKVDVCFGISIICVLKGFKLFSLSIKHCL